MGMREAVTEARAKKEAGFFDRRVITREIKTISTDSVTLECGHSSVTLPLYRAEDAADKEYCGTCAAMWIHDAAAAAPADVAEALP